MIIFFIFPLQLCSILCIVLLQTVALYTGKTWAQAPGDVDAECQIERFRNTYPEGNFILMDTYNYDRLLGDPHPVWTDGDYDDNNDPNSFFLTRVSTCICFYMSKSACISCNVRAKYDIPVTSQYK